MRKLLRGLALSLVPIGIASVTFAQGPVHTPRVHALTNVRIVQSPGVIIEKGTVVIRDGLIESVGASVAVPADARIWELDSLTVYAGMIDLAMEVSPPKADDKSDTETLKHELSVVHPDYVAGEQLALSDSDAKARRSEGILAARVLPDKGAFRGQAAFLNLGDGSLAENLIKKRCGQVVAFGTAGDDNYPGSLMGTVAVLRQTFYDARWYDAAQTAYAANPRGKERPDANAALEALAPAMNGETPLIFMTNDVLDLLRAGEMGKEFALRFSYVGSGEEYKRLDDVRAYTSELVIPVNFPKAPSVDDEGAVLSITTSTLRQWADAPSNPAQVHDAGFTFALTARGLKDVGAFRKNVAKAVAAGLPADVALRATTVTPARMMGVSTTLGTVEAGKVANLVIADGELFAEKTKLREVWVDGARYALEEVKEPEGDPRGTWALVATAGDGAEYPSTLIIEGEIGALTGKINMMGSELPVELTQSGTTVKVSIDASALGIPGAITMDLAMKGESVSGSGNSPMGSFTVSGKREAAPGAEGGAR